MKIQTYNGEMNITSQIVSDKVKKHPKSILAGFLAVAMVVAGIASYSPQQADAATTWDTSGSYVVGFQLTGDLTTYSHDMTLIQDGSDNLDGNGGYPAGGPFTFEWDIVSGNVVNDIINITADYTVGAPGTTMHMTGIIAPDGSMSGTWDDNYGGGSRDGTWATSSGNAVSTATPLDYTVDPWVYDPDLTGTAVSEWVANGYEPGFTPLDKNLCKKDGWKTQHFGGLHPETFKNQGQCVSFADNYNAAHTEYVLNLEKNAPTATNSAAGAELMGVEGITLDELGFDYKGYCGAGAPRFNVYTADGYYFFGCSIYGTHTDLGGGWTEVRYSDADAVVASGPAWPGFGSVEITGIDIVFDEGTDVGTGQVFLDNIDVNGTIVGNP